MAPSPAIVAKRPVVFLAPGAGLGHLVRTGALCLGLVSRGIPSIILASSPYGPGFSRLTGLHVVTVPMNRWKDSCPKQVAALNPALLVQDTFPCGLKGENLPAMAGSQPLVVLSRRLKWSAYMDALDYLGPRHEPQGFTALVMEPLSPHHLDWLERRACHIISLDNRICFPFSQISLPKVPPDLKRAIEANTLHLVVHSGPEQETRLLMARAQAEIRKLGHGRLAVINPAMAAEGIPMCFDYFPAAALYSRAAHVYTGAGYNAVAEAETAGLNGTHTLLAFERRYDDQEWRKTRTKRKEIPGNDTALKVIEDLYSKEQAGAEAPGCV